MEILGYFYSYNPLFTTVRP